MNKQIIAHLTYCYHPGEAHGDLTESRVISVMCVQDDQTRVGVG